MRWPGLQRETGPPLAPVAPEDFTEGRLIYAVGDLHGRLDLLDRMIARIADDAEAEGPAERPLLVFLGDYVDRGPDSRGVIETLMRLGADGEFQVECLRGNHEAALLGFLTDVEAGPIWATWGGDATLRSYGVPAPPPNAPSPEWADAQAAFAAAIPQAHVAFLEALPLSLMLGGYLFVHAGVRPGVPLDRQASEDLLMIRQPFLGHERPLGRVVVHGHTPEEAPVVTPVRIGIDSGAYATGVLTAARLYGAEVEILQVRAG